MLRPCSTPQPMINSVFQSCAGDSRSNVPTIHQEARF